MNHLIELEYQIQGGNCSKSQRRWVVITLKLFFLLFFVCLLASLSLERKMIRGYMEGKRNTGSSRSNGSEAEWCSRDEDQDSLAPPMIWESKEGVLKLMADGTVTTKEPSLFLEALELKWCKLHEEFIDLSAAMWEHLLCGANWP